MKIIIHRNGKTFEDKPKKKIRAHDTMTHKQINQILSDRRAQLDSESGDTKAEENQKDA